MGNKRLFVLLCIGSGLIISFRSVQENTTPKVTIISPAEDSKLEWNTVVPYRITVVDKEDGSSDYDEINVNEVVLSLTYFDDPSKARKYAEEKVASRSDMLSYMATSNCFTCHKAKDRLMGPSFEEIANRYSPTSENTTYLAQKIREGSKGVWSDEIMPGQPELETARIVQMLEWIFKNAKDPDYIFYTGTEGAFKTKEKPKALQSRAAYVLYAQYKDHGIDESHQQSKIGIDTGFLIIE